MPFLTSICSALPSIHTSPLQDMPDMVACINISSVPATQRMISYFILLGIFLRPVFCYVNVLWYKMLNG
jgi:hypothetical protein